MARSGGCDDIQDLAALRACASEQWGCVQAVASLPAWLLGESVAHVKVSGYRRIDHSHVRNFFTSGITSLSSSHCKHSSLGSLYEHAHCAEDVLFGQGSQLCSLPEQETEWEAEAAHTRRSLCAEAARLSCSFAHLLQGSRSFKCLLSC